MSKEPVEGVQFRFNYLMPAHKLSDSDRARVRLVHLIKIVNKQLGIDEDDISDALAQYLGVTHHPAHVFHDKRGFWVSSSVGDFLSSITMLYRLFNPKVRAMFLDNVRQIFREEHLRYGVDSLGGVHFSIDEAFERNVSSTIDGLGAPKYVNAKNAIEAALVKLSESQYGGFVEEVYRAVETAFLVTIETTDSKLRLNLDNLKTHLGPILQKRYHGVPGANDMIDRLFNHYGAWAKAVHPARHGTAHVEQRELPLDYALVLGEQGMSILRHIVATP